MNIRRIERISAEIQRVVSDIIINGLKDPRVDELTTVTDVKVTRDLSYANIYVSVLGDEKKKKDTIIGLENAKGFIRKEISDNVKLRHTPKPVFHLDESIEKGIRISKLINEVNKGSDEDNE